MDDPDLGIAIDRYSAPGGGQYGTMTSPMRRAEIEELASSIRAILADADLTLNEPIRRRWEGALVALEIVLGEPSSLVDNLGFEFL